MSWECRMVDVEERRAWKAEHPREDLPVGWMWYANADFANAWHLSSYYREHNSNRPPLIVQMPGNYAWCVDECTTDGQPDDRGWDVTGEPPKITISPSINQIGVYHGYIRDGVITDDVEGRTFPR